MSIWIPPDSDLALALLEPALITPAKKPLGEVKLVTDRLRPAWAWMNVAPYSVPRDLASGAIYQVVGTSIKPGPEYWTFGTKDTLDRINLGPITSAHPLSLQSPAGFTVIADVYNAIGIDTAFPRVIDKSDGGGWSNGWAIDYRTSSGIYEFGNDNGSATVSASQNKRHRLIFTGAGSAAGVTKTGYVLQDGVWSSASLTEETPATTTNACVGNWNHTAAPSREWQGRIYFVMVFDWQLPLHVAQYIALNPNRVLRPANDTPYLFPVAGGGGVSQELTGNSSTSAVGTLGVSAEANVSVTSTGVAGSSAVGTLGVTAKINASAELSGVAATSAVGTLTAEVGGGATVALSGVAGTATVGALTAAGQINEFVDLLGNSATGAVGTLIVVTGLQVALSGNAATGAAGTLGITAEVNASATLTGVGSSGAVGTLEVTVPIAVSVELTGVGATGAIGTLTAVGAGQVWTEISPVSTIWTEIS